MSAGGAGGPGDEFKLPDVGEGLDQAEIVEWLVAEGDHVERDQPLVEILTDKSQTQLPSPKAGVIKRLGFAEGDMAEVGQVLVEFDAVQSAPTTAPPATPLTEPDAMPIPPPPVAATASPGRRPKASPAVRRRAMESDLDLASVEGTGPGGRITIDDLDAARSGGNAARSGEMPFEQPILALASTLGQMSSGRHPLRGIRRVTAEAMAQSWQIPHIHAADEFDASNLLAGRRRIKSLHPEQARALTPVAFFVMAVAHSLRRYPLMNASITLATDDQPGHIDVHDDINVGIAVATEAGLLVPVIRHADQLSLFGLAEEIARLSAAARDRSIGAIDLRSGTCTISNYGSLGGRFAAPIIRAPEAAIVGFGAIRERPIAVAGRVEARPTLPIAVAADHRLIDGDLMTAFQEHVIGLLTDPVALLAR